MANISFQKMYYILHRIFFPVLCFILFCFLLPFLSKGHIWRLSSLMLHTNSKCFMCLNLLHDCKSFSGKTLVSLQWKSLAFRMAIKHVLRCLFLHNYIYTCAYIQGYCQRLSSMWVGINVCNLKRKPFFCQDWKMHYWVIHCVLQHISNDWRVWNSEQISTLRWIDQQNTFVQVLSVWVNTTVCLKYIKRSCCVFHTSQQWGQNVLHVVPHG